MEEALALDAKHAQYMTRFPWLYARSPLMTWLAEHPRLEQATTWMIVLNTVVLAMDSHPESPEKTKAFMKIGFVLNMVRDPRFKTHTLTSRGRCSRPRCWSRWPA
jgi:hypothetical protein